MSMAVEMLAIVACATAAGATCFLMLERREARQFAASKAEELYTLIETFDQGLIAFFEQSCAMAAKRRLYQPADSGLAELMRDSAKARMLISFYFPTLWPTVRRADAAVAATVAALQRYYAEPTHASALHLETVMSDLREAMETLKHAVVTAHRDGPARRIRRRLLGPSRPVAVAA